MYDFNLYSRAVLFFFLDSKSWKSILSVRKEKIWPVLRAGADNLMEKKEEKTPHLLGFHMRQYGAQEREWS